MNQTPSRAVKPGRMEDTMHEVKIYIPDETTDPELKALYDEFISLSDKLGQPPLSWDSWYINMLLFSSKHHVVRIAKLFVHSCSNQVSQEGGKCHEQ